MQIPPALVLGCNTQHGVCVLSDWIEEHLGFVPDFTSTSIADENTAVYERNAGHGFGYGFYGDGNGSAYGFTDGIGCGTGIGRINGDGFGYGYGYSFGEGNGCGFGDPCSRNSEIYT